MKVIIITILLMSATAVYSQQAHTPKPAASLELAMDSAEKAEAKKQAKAYNKKHRAMSAWIRKTIKNNTL
jgi:hypothetical protein